VQTDCVEPWEARQRRPEILTRKTRRKRAEHVDEAPRKREARRASGEGEQHAFSQQLTDEAPAAGAERGAHCHLPLTRQRSSELEVRDVHARDEQHQADGACEHEQRGPDRGSDAVLPSHAVEVRAMAIRVPGLAGCAPESRRDRGDFVGRGLRVTPSASRAITGTRANPPGVSLDTSGVHIQALSLG